MSKKKIVYVKKSDVIRYAEWEGAYKALMYISRLPGEDVRIVKHGRWSECYTDTHHYSGICSVCGKASIKSLTQSLYEYCPRCGARMDLKEAEKNEKIKKRV